MKREIICVTCSNLVKERCGDSLNPYPGEYLKFVDGRAIRTCKCDHCGVAINALEKCCAYSVSTNKAPYYEWEHEYIFTQKGE